MSFLYTQKKSPFELHQLYKHFHIYSYGCSPVLTEVNGILPLTSLGTGAVLTWTTSALLKSHGSGQKRVWQSTHKTEELISPLQRADCLLCHYFTCVKLLILHWSFS